MIVVNKIAIFFIGIIILGLGIGIYFSSSSQSRNRELNVFATPTPIQDLPKGISTASGTPTPTLTPRSASSAVIKTVKGEVKIKFYPQDAPKTVTNFATLADSKFYDGLTFHRVEPGFVVQGGDPLSKDANPQNDGTGGYSIYGTAFEDELNPETDSYKEGYTEGTVAMANRGPNTNTSQFFIMWADKPDLPRNYTIFGKVTEGMETVKKMVAGDKIISITVE